MSITMPEVAETRALMLSAYHKSLVALIEDATQRPGDVADGENGELLMTLGDWDGVPVVTRKRLDEAIRAVFGQAIPAPSETTVEVSTPATVYLSTACPECGLARVIPVSLRGQLTVDDDGAELAAKAKSKPVPHICGQLALPEPAEDVAPEQVGLLMEIESLGSRVHGLLEEVAALPGEEGGEEMPSADTIRSWDRATIDQVDAWATAYLAATQRPGHVPPLPRVLGGEADPEPAGEPEGETRPCPACGAPLRDDETHWSLFPEPMGGYACPVAEAEGEEDAPEPGWDPTATAEDLDDSDDDDLLPGEPDAES